MIKSRRFTLKRLTEEDASIRYLGWFEESNTKAFIRYASSSIKELKDYITTKNADSRCLLLGIFADDEHIGNIKYEPIDLVNKSATMGILLGETQWRGKGVAAEVISASADFLVANHGVECLLLGVDKSNIPAINAYQKIGFEITEQTEHGLFMRKSLQ